jgi:DNA-binding transcriptional LysR family regulator
MQIFEPSFRALRLLQMIEEQGGLVKAAAQVGLSQSAASHAIASLERESGAKLFVRGRGALRLSDTCTRLLPHVRQILQALDAIHEELAAEAGVQQGAIRIAAVPSLASSVIPPLMREFGKRYPGVAVNLLEGTDQEVADWVRKRVCHCGFAALPVAGLETQPLAEDEWTILAPAGEFGGQTQTGLKQLGRRKFLLSGGGCEEHIRTLFQQDGLDLPDHILVRQMDTLQAMVAENLGVTLIPSLCLRQRPKNTRAVRLRPRRYRTIGLLLATGVIPSPGLHRWIELVKAQFSGIVKRATAF